MSPKLELETLYYLPAEVTPIPTGARIVGGGVR